MMSDGHEVQVMHSKTLVNHVHQRQYIIGDVCNVGNASNVSKTGNV